MQLMIWDPQMNPVGVIDNRLPNALSFKEDIHHEKLELGFRTLDLKVPANHPTSRLIEKGGFLLYPSEKNKLELFQIFEPKEVHDKDGLRIELHCENSAVGDLTGVILRPMKLTSSTIENAMEQVLKTSKWSVGEVEHIGLRDFEFTDYPTALSAVHEILKAFDAEIDFEVKLKGNRIDERLIHVRKHRGRDTKRLFRYRQDMKGASRNPDNKQVVTALIGVGKSDSNGKTLTLVGYGPTVEKGFEKGSDWIGNIQAMQKYGIEGQHRFAVFKDESATSQAELYKRTLAELKKVSKPAISYTVDVALLGDCQIGDTIRVQDEELDFFVEARVIEKRTTLSAKGKDSVTIGEIQSIAPNHLITVKRLEHIIQQNQAKWDEGIISANRVKGGTLAVGGESGTLIETKDIKNEEEIPIGYISNREVNLERVSAAVIVSPSIVSRNATSYTLYVSPKKGSDGSDGDEDSPLATIGEAFRRIPKYNDGHITILIVDAPGKWREEEPAVLGGIAGSGSITLDFQTQDNILESRIFLANCSQSVLISNGKILNHTMFDGDQSVGVCNITNCSWVHLKNMSIDAVAGSNLMYAISQSGPSFVRVENCEAYNGEYAQIRVFDGATLSLYKEGTAKGGCKGSGGAYGLFAYNGAIVGGAGDCPTGTTGNLYTALGALANIAPTYNPGTKPDDGKVTIETHEWTATSVNSYRPNFGWRNDGTLRQGKYQNYGNHMGLVFFNYTDMQAKMEGKTVRSVQLYLERQAGGSNSAQAINLYQHNYASSPSGAPSISLVQNNAGSFAIGSSGKKYISIPTSVGEAIQEGDAKGIAIYASSGNPYLVFGKNVKLKITVEG